MLTRMSEEDWDVVLMVFRAVLPRRGDKGRDGKRGKTPGSSPNGGVRTRKEVSVFKRIPEAPIPEA
jgi:hypothetical protein